MLLALLAEPNVASEVLGGLGITHERFKDHLTTLRRDPDDPQPTARSHAHMNPLAYGLIGWATGFAAAAGVPSLWPEHWLIAFLYSNDGGAVWLHPLGVTANAVTHALATRGVRVPSFAPPEHKPWRGGHMVYVPMKELQPIIDVLSEKHPPGSEWRWGYNMVGKPQRGRVHAEKGIDLAAVIALARKRMITQARPRRKSSR